MTKLKFFPTSARAAMQFGIVVACLTTADPSSLSLLLGLLISSLGEVFRLWAAGFGYKMGAVSGRGPYRVVRHPYYLGSTLLFVGFAVAGRNPYVVAFSLLGLAWIYRKNMREDEALMASHLGPSYAVYRVLVPAFMPRLVPLDTANLEMRDFASTARLGRPASIISGPEKFSFKYAVLTGKHRELDALLLIVFGFGILTLASLVMDQRLFRFATVGVVGIYLLLRVIYYTSFKKFARRS